MELISKKVNINFMGMRFVCMLLSLGLIALSIVTWTGKGIEKYSVDFVGGNEIWVKFEKPIEIATIRTALDGAGIRGAVVQAFQQGLEQVGVETADSSPLEFSIRLKTGAKTVPSSDEAHAADVASGGTGIKVGTQIKEALASIPENSFELLKQDFVGPVIGEQIRNNGIKAMMYALACILIYISFRFEWRFAVGAIAALVHDVIITTGLFVMAGRELSAPVLAALLTIIGYSLNDTIIVFDRVRENLFEARKGKKKKKKQEGKEGRYSFLKLLNRSVNQTLSRTVLTSITTLLVVGTLWLLGGGAVADLAFALVIGVVVGTYSSIFVACTIVYALAGPAQTEDV